VLDLRNGGGEFEKFTPALMVLFLSICLVNYHQTCSWVLLAIQAPNLRGQFRSHNFRRRTTHRLQRILTPQAIKLACTNGTIMWLVPID
jgi:hypothetical protein